MLLWPRSGRHLSSRRKAITLLNYKLENGFARFCRIDIAVINGFHSIRQCNNIDNCCHDPVLQCHIVYHSLSSCQMLDQFNLRSPVPRIGELSNHKY